jgi:hypothetical protein
MRLAPNPTTREDELRDFRVSPVARRLQPFRRTLDRERDEAALRALLQQSPFPLVRDLFGSHRYVVPRARLGAEHAPDFLVGERSSFGVGWLAVQLASPVDDALTPDGAISASLKSALDQITHWRLWLSCRTAGLQGSLSLENLCPEMPALIVLGRRSTERRLEALDQTAKLAIRSYDWLFAAPDLAGRRAAVMDRLPRRGSFGSPAAAPGG